MVELTEVQIEYLVRGYLSKVLEGDERQSVTGWKERPQVQELLAHRDGMAYAQDDCYRELAIGNYSRASGAVARLLEEEGIRLDRDGVSYHLLCRQMMNAMINHLEIDMRRSLRDHSLAGLPFPEISPEVAR